MRDTQHCVFFCLIIYSMAIIATRGNWEKKYFRKRASTAFAMNSLVTEHSDDDTITPATSGSAFVVGICVKKIAATDSDYASNTRICVLVPKDSSAEMLCDTASTIAATDEGELMDLTDDLTVNQAASSTDIVKLKQFVSTTKGIFCIYKKAFI